MNLKRIIYGILCIVIALAVMLLMTHYAKFYAPSYFFWIGIILSITGIISLVVPLNFLMIFNRLIASFVLIAGLLFSITALNWPVRNIHSTNKQKIDNILPDYSFNEYHEVIINATADKVKAAWQSTPVRDIPMVDFLMRIRGLPANKEEKKKVASMNQNAGTFHTPDFNYFEVDSTEFITVLLIKASAKKAPPEIKSIDQFMNFNDPGYIKVAMNFRIIQLDNGNTQVTTETRNYGLTQVDCRIFGRYWRVVYPGSAIIRRLWLDTLAKKAIH